MKLSVLSITTVFVSFVAAAPAIVPRDPSRMFSLTASYTGGDPGLHLTMEGITEDGYPGYYRLGWFGVSNEHGIELMMEEDSSKGEPVFSVDPINYQMPGELSSGR